MTDKEKDKCLDDLILWGQAITKTEIEDGKPTVKYIDPVSDEARVAMYNAEHTDSAMQIIPIDTKLSDRMLAFIWDYEFAMLRIRNICQILPNQLGKKDTFRIPRKLKKTIKNLMGGKWTKRQARFNLDVYNTMPYYGGNFLKEKP